MKLIETTVGLPNTCSVCGKDPGDTWFATSEEQAFAGAGLCKDDATPEKETSKAKTASKAKAADK